MSNEGDANRDDSLGDDSLGDIAVAEKRNFWVLTLHHILLRISWLFKTESVIIPAFVDTIAGPAWVRGWLPLLSRVGQSGPPLLFAPMLRAAPRKRVFLFLLTWLMAAPFFAIGLAWTLGVSVTATWLPFAFLTLYFLFFCCSGLYTLTWNATQGKLIQPQRRGRLMLFGSVGGTIAAVSCAALLLVAWLETEPISFGAIFLFSSAVMIVSGLSALLLNEPAVSVPHAPWRNPLKDAWSLLRTDQRFRLVALMAFFFGAAQLGFPHYYSLGRMGQAFSPLSTFSWVIAQNVGAGMFSIIAGTLADRFGNRLALRFAGGIATMTPLLALYFSPVDGNAHPAYWLVFLSLGLTPIMYKTQMNYVLELAPSEDHPRYLSTFSLCLATPFLFSVPVGYCIDLWDFPPVFIALACSAGVSMLLTFAMAEPRSLTQSQA